jgi:Ribbon-helix-helix protein, copG family
MPAASAARAAQESSRVSADQPTGTRKVSFNLPEDEIEQLRELAKARHTTATQVVRQALATELFLQQLVDRGARLLSRVGLRGPLEEIHLPFMKPSG